jgi:hypothetical protein
MKYLTLFYTTVCKTVICVYMCIYVCVESFYDVWQRFSTPSLKISLSTHCPSRKSHSFLALSTPSFPLLFGLPRLLLPVGVQFKIVLCNLSSPILWRCPKQTIFLPKFHKELYFYVRFSPIISFRADLRQKSISKASIFIFISLICQTSHPFVVILFVIVLLKEFLFPSVTLLSHNALN